MNKRIGFNVNEDRKEFFQAVRDKLKLSSWGALAIHFGKKRNHFQYYQYGWNLIPQTLFDQMIQTLDEESQAKFKQNIFEKVANWGAVKGGKATSLLHPELFEERRKKGQTALRRILEERYPRHDYSQISLSIELCEFVGAYVGDGCGCLNGKTVSIVGHASLDLDYLLYMKSIIDQLFQLKGKLLFAKYKNAVYLRYYSTELYQFMAERFGFPKGKKVEIVQIPSLIECSSKELLFRTIRGVFDTDGCVFFDKRKKYATPYPRIRLQVKSKPLIDQLEKILSSDFRISRPKCRTRKHHTIEIYGHEQFDKWMKIVGFSNSKHLNRIQKYKPLARFERATSSLPMTCNNHYATEAIVNSS